MKEQQETTGYDRETLRRVQEASLKILLEVDRICRKNGIQYLLDAGTLIGAVRHQGFIPWDDDVDIAMTRQNFERFVNVLREAEKKEEVLADSKDAFCENRKEAEDIATNATGRIAAETDIKGSRLPDSMELVMPDSYRDGTAFYDFTPRIIYKPSRRHTNSGETAYYEGKLNHLWVDIFILDHIPDGKAADRWTRFLQKCIYGLSMPHRYALDMGKYSLKDRIKVGVLTAAGRFFSMPKLFLYQERLSKKYNDKETKRLYYSNYQPDFLHVTLEREWAEETTDLQFEGHALMAPANYDAVLREIYGDYMKLPPKEAQVPSHSEAPELLDAAF